MSDYMSDIGKVYSMSGSAAAAASSSVTADKSTNKKAGAALEMEDYLSLMVATLQNQTIDDTADMSEMMSQMVQMSLISAINEISTLVSDSSVMTYAASLVGKEVTVGQYSEDGTLIEILGTVTGTGTLNGKQVIFLDDDESYYLTDILAVGRLPDKDGVVHTKPATGEEDAEEIEGSEQLKQPDKVEETVQPGKTEGTDKTEAAGQTEQPAAGDKLNETEQEQATEAVVTQNPEKAEERANVIHEAADETVKHEGDAVQESDNTENMVIEARSADGDSHSEKTEI